MKRITFLTAAFLCLSGLTESPAQDTQSNRNMEELKLTQESVSYTHLTLPTIYSV